VRAPVKLLRHWPDLVQPVELGLASLSAPFSPAPVFSFVHGYLGAMTISACMPAIVR
jgi:hypothetical protein